MVVSWDKGDTLKLPVCVAYTLTDLFPLSLFPPLLSFHLACRRRRGYSVGCEQRRGPLRLLWHGACGCGLFVVAEWLTRGGVLGAGEGAGKGKGVGEGAKVVLPLRRTMTVTLNYIATRR